MKKVFLRCCLFIAFVSVSEIKAQGSLDDYKRSVAIDTLFSNKVYNAPEEFHWLENDLMWYASDTREGRKYFLVSLGQRKKKEAFDHKRLADSLSVLLDKEILPQELEVKDLEFNEDHSVLSFSSEKLRIACELDTYKLSVIEKEAERRRNNGYWGERNNERNNDPEVSPDGAWKAYIEDHNLFVENIKSGEQKQLSYDGSKGFFYSSHIYWSPDSQKLMAYKVRPGQEHKIYFVESSPEDQLQPKLQSRDYLKPGDELAFKSPQLFKVASGDHIEIPTTLFDRQYDVSNFEWEENSSAFTFEYNQRGHQIYRVLRVDAASGEIKAIIEESSPTFIDYSGKNYRHDIADGNEIIWASERDGWNHLYLIDGISGRVKNQITKGAWPVREVLKVDEEKQQIYFTASGMDKNQDPYFMHYFRIDFDGDNLVRFTSENGTHKVNFSPDYNYYVDQYSRINLPPVTLLKNAENAEVVMELENADISDLLATGWQTPEPFKAKGRDGKTDIWGMIVRPTNFDPKVDYPVIEYIYAGPHDSFVPKEFHARYWAMSSLAELGFIVVQIDGMGTSNRSKAFHDVCWKNLKDAGFPDRKLWMKAAAKKYPYMNIDKVGIHGTSAGGQSAGGALVFNSDFYDVAVASCGCHDNRMDKIWWNEQWMGYPVGPQYAASSNIEHANRMEGNLMLIVGELDDNVDPASTMQFADALIKANKDFELVVIPGMGHSSGGEYGDRKRKDFFVEHLLGVTPPDWDEVYGEEK